MTTRPIRTTTPTTPLNSPKITPGNRDLLNRIPLPSMYRTTPLNPTTTLLMVLPLTPFRIQPRPSGMVRRRTAGTPKAADMPSQPKRKPREKEVAVPRHPSPLASSTPLDIDFGKACTIFFSFSFFVVTACRLTALIVMRVRCACVQTLQLIESYRIIIDTTTALSNDHLVQYPLQRLPARILGAPKKAMWLRSDRHVTPFTSMRLSRSHPCLLGLESRGACTRGANLFRLQCNFNPRMAEGTLRSVSFIPLLIAPWAQLIGLYKAPEHCVTPVGLCTQSLYVKKTYQPNRSTLSFANLY